MAVGSLIFLSITAVGRASTGSDAEKSRYLHIALALLLPLVAVTVDLVARRWPVLLVPLMALFLVGVPWNLSKVHELQKDPFEGRKRDVLVLARSDAIRELPPNFRPFSASESHITVGWLRDGIAAGHIPRPARKLTGEDEANAYSIVALTAPAETPSAPCRPTSPSPNRILQRGDVIRFRRALDIKTRREGGALSTARRLKAKAATAVVFVRAPIEVTFVRGTDTLCR
jgi:hypothetical protein